MPLELTQADAIWFEEEHRQIRTEILEQDVAPLEAFEMFDIETDVDPGAQEFGSDMITYFGDADVIGNNTDNINFANVGIYRQVHPIVALANGYKWTYPEVLKAAGSRKVPSRLRGVAARDAMFQTLNKIFIDGKAEYGVHGLMTYPGVPKHVMQTTFSASDDAQDILDDLFDLFLRPVEATLGVEKPRALWLPLDKYMHIAVRPLSLTNGSNATILSYFKEKVKGIIGVEPEVRGSWMLQAHNKCVVFRRGAAATNKLVIPGNMRWVQLEMQRYILEFRVPCIAMCGGFYTEYPLRMCVGVFSA